MSTRALSLDALFLVVFVLLTAGITWAMFAARANTLAAFSAQQPQQDWQDWRSAVKEGDADMGNVKRRVPRSTEPPTLVLLRDHFTTCLVGLLGISSVLYASLVFLIRGVLRSFPSSHNQPRPIGNGISEGGSPKSELGTDDPTDFARRIFRHRAKTGVGMRL